MGNLEQAMKDNNKANSFIKVDITNMDIFQDTVKLIVEVCKDKRIDRSIREEYKEKLFGIINEKDYVPVDLD